MVYDVHLPEKVCIDQRLYLTRQPEKRILNCLIRMRDKREDILSIHEYKDGDFAHFVHLLSTICACDSYAGNSKKLVEHINRKYKRFLLKDVLRSFHGVMTKGNRVDLFYLIFKYFNVLNAMMSLMDNGWKKLEQHFPVINITVEKLMLLDTNDVYRNGRQLYMLEIITQKHKKDWHTAELQVVGTEKQLVLAIKTEKACTTGKKENIAQILNIKQSDTKKRLESLYTDENLRDFLHFIAISYKSKSKQLKNLLALLYRNRSAFSLKKVQEVVNNVITQEKGTNLQKFITDYLITLKVLIKFSKKGLLDVEEVFSDIKKLPKKLMHVKMEDPERVMWELEKIRRYIQEKQKDKLEQYAEDLPEENFRELSVVPGENDVLDPRVPYLRKNVVIGSYKSIEHYLDVHFRLMREDMLQSFRACISCSRQKLSNADKHFDNGRLFSNVLVEYPPEYTLDGVAYTIIVQSLNSEWSKAKSLKPGTLICLSFDRFSSITFATVRDTIIKDETQVQLRVVLEHPGKKLSHKMKYALVESDGYFEPYRHVLQLLQEVNMEEFPLVDCIVYLNYEQCQAKHLSSSSFGLNVKEANDEHREIYTYKYFDLFDLRKWPTADRLGMDENQRQAFHLALTKKLALIQGPPGTGKTHLACKIVEALLVNGVSRPIFICCASNHTLDKFLVKLLPHTQKIVRVGSQGRTEALQTHLLSSLVEVLKIHRALGKVAVEKMDISQKRTMLILKAICPHLPVSTRKPPDSSIRYAITNLCGELNELYNDYIDCSSNYFNDGILNKIIGHEQKAKIIAGAGSSRNVLRNCVIEWLALYKSSENIYEQCENMWQEVEKTEYLKACEQEEGENIDNEEQINVWRIPLTKRFFIFYEWRKRLLKKLRSRINEKERRYLLTFKKHKKHAHEETVSILRNADIVGMTTCGAAKYHHYMIEAAPKVMLIEEAAEIFESHVITALVPSIEHLILIGDHEQLRPLTTTYGMSRDFHLDVSMFERLLKNGAPSVRLTRQYRMRPEIANLLVPYFYETLDSHPIVTQYDDIAGIASNVFFMKHSHLEDQQFLSRVSTNQFEARFIAKLCEYLLFQGYKQSQITILVAYYGQIEVISRYIDFEIKGLQLCTVDSYQGEENDIILISFVRSNIYGDTGFLSQSERICVSLSRARIGLYCIGNFDMLASKSSLWACISKRLESMKMIGNEFPVQCRNHKEEILHLRHPEEFADFIASGCGAKCEFQLTCGHRCSRICHFDDRTHESYKCLSPCAREIEVRGKVLPCRKLCWEVCRKKKCNIALPCGHQLHCKQVDIERIQQSYKCNEEYERLLPCGHFVSIPCYKSVESTLLCSARVLTVLKCGHKKMVTCSELQNGELLGMCEELSNTVGLCGHTVLVPCVDSDNADLALRRCSRVCDILLNCGHPCTGFCKKCFRIKIHEICVYDCDLKLPCGHKCKGLCSMPCPPCEEPCEMRCSHSTCPNRCERPCVKCLEPCDRQCQHKICDKKCWEPCTPCGQPCSKALKCGHQCTGMCGEPCPTRCRICDFDETNYSRANTELFVLLEDCGHCVEVKEMRSYIERAIQGFEWPTCPTCNTKVTRNIHFDSELKMAKDESLKITDPEDEILRVNKLLDKVFPRKYVISWKLCSLHEEIKHILTNEKPSTNYLYILRHCLTAIKNLKDIEQCIAKERPQLKSRFDEMVKWITEHLRHATYQQLEELDVQVNQLIILVKENISV